ncbi:peptidase family M48-domain-containing protein [Boletus edulis BED1]|uniref:Peptidase family M48-domain-containing protein n=1 Tax=Boletus edulis BED1 TaxID=1328754 RepID=A0AAD4BQS9_BOLED|nr:peptidase family M48-domain-containing protein [Boletus edulis BED1]
MFTILPRRTIPALGQSRLRTVFSVPSCIPVHPLRASVPFRSPLSRPQRQFSTSSPLRVQYTRFSDTHTYHSRRPDQNKVTKVVVFVTAAGVVYYIAHLEQVPETGRWRFMDISPKFEAKLEEASYASLLSEFEGRILPAKHPITRHVHRVVSGLLEASDLGTLGPSDPSVSPAVDDGFWRDDPFAAARPHDPHTSPGGKEWNLLVVNDPKIVNALASFGTIVVFTGILPVCKDEQGLAAVVGHEIGHAVARHASERYSSSKILILLAILLQAVGIDFGVARMLNYLLFKLPNSRTQELEADTLGMRIAAKACYDPRSAVEMHTRLARASESGGVGFTLEFLRTHPVPERRIKHLEELVPEAYEIIAANPQCAGIRNSVEQFLGAITRWG